ncbi:hypothetical protein HY483_02750 [Candidatus Woesearchaeota archaeon]|nr:hypothetical protein [Candidatus Woesearchaeota archaeon]
MNIYEYIKGKTFQGEWSQPAEQGSCDMQRGAWFLLRIIEANSKNGFFLGHCKDELGESGIIGTINEVTIEFHKRYAGFEPFPGTGRFKEVTYRGKILETGNIIKAQGTYHPTQELSDRLNGTWQMILIQENPQRRAEDLEKPETTERKPKSAMNVYLENA